jgi:hypothetical protein
MLTKFKFYSNLIRITATLHEDRCVFMTVPRYILRRMRNFSDKSSREQQNSHFMFNIFFRKSYPLIDNVEKYGRAGQATDVNLIRCMGVICCITKAADRHSE